MCVYMFMCVCVGGWVLLYIYYIHIIILNIMISCNIIVYVCKLYLEYHCYLKLNIINKV